MSTIEMYKYFAERGYQNQETLPIRITTDEEVITYVSENPGAIGYIMSSSLTSNKKCKVICSVSH